ncbi:PQQ-binding-like beta-propeller repeat protein [Halorubrum sp. AD140]|uniref:outer membrane protein assembly factor BamB family protein n=1 Tax=Halorubrum sp. AD140 TaxID=3050073 RepID=UPI002ACC3BF0|nr:PQQ-binding-like beta-propeller repeat protein [Halorubrum sp. AD140]MDZ5809924.1 PQQ-binding-like beta-propeller repeat protein [Halorubrum sp. AD140]
MPSADGPSDGDDSDRDERDDGDPEADDGNRRLPVSRRAALSAGAVGLTTGVGWVAGYATGVGRPPWTDPDPDPTAVTRAVDQTAWPVVGRDPASTRRAPTAALPDGDLAVAWTERKPQEASDPVVAHGLAYTADWFLDDRHRLRAIDLSTGEEAWSARFTADRTGASPPAVAGDLLYYHDGDRLRAHSAVDGSEAWTAAPPAGLGTRSVPVAGRLIGSGRRVDEADASAVVAVGNGNGERSWARSYPAHAFAPRAADGAAFVPLYGWDRSGDGTADEASGDGNGTTDGDGNGTTDGDGNGTTDGDAGERDGVVALDAETGDERWRSDEVPRVSEMRAIGHGLVLVTTFDRRLVALDVGDGSRRWTARSAPESRYGRETEISPPDFDPVAIGPDRLFARYDDPSDRPGRIAALDPETGEELWTHAPADESPRTDGHFWFTGPTVVGDRVLVTANERNEWSVLRELDAATGAVRREVDLPDVAPETAPLVAEERVILGGFRSITALEPV